MNDLEFDRFGDFSFVGNDINVIRDIDYVYQHTIDRLITNFGDYYLQEEFGANLSSFIGQNNNRETEEKIRQSIIRALTEDDFLPSYLISIAISRSGPNMLIKIEIGNSIVSSIDETIVINSIFNTSSGLFYVTA